MYVFLSVFSYECSNTCFKLISILVSPVHIVYMYIHIHSRAMHILTSDSHIRTDQYCACIHTCTLVHVNLHVYMYVHVHTCTVLSFGVHPLKLTACTNVHVNGEHLSIPCDFETSLLSCFIHVYHVFNELLCC